jgi:pilus assembly protein CpaE
VSSSKKVSRDKSLHVIAICVDSDSLSRINVALEQFPGAQFDTFTSYLGQKSDLPLIQRFTQWEPDVFIVDFDENRDKAIRTAEQLQEVLSGKVSIFAISSKSEPELIISAMRAGCSEYLVKPAGKDRLVEALTKIDLRKRERQGTQKKGKVVSLLGAKGGTGVTSIAVHLSTFLAKLGKNQKTVLIDHHPDLGDASLYLGIDKHSYHFYELVNSVERLDPELVQGFAVHHSSGLDVLASPGAFDSIVNVTEADVEQTIEFLRTLYDYVVIDCAPGITGLNVAAVQTSDEVCLVATQELPAIRNLSRYLEHLARFSFPADRVEVLVNRFAKKGAITNEQIERALKKPIKMAVPNSYAEVMAAINSGTPVAPDKSSEFVTVLRKWATSLMQSSAPAAVAKEEPKQAKRRFGILGIEL